ncbi:MAG TPA: GH92 family glycosyl hydrolase [Candidatus Sulfopaludibacter sp.]|jgi:predicted alpha-1,2-mannosidase|nr:GH92 family glycosyl hydrolase [Candidatus Sulfopaludibacter sp.]
MRSLLLCALAAGALAQTSSTPPAVEDPAALVNPLIGTANGGNTFPGAVLPFGMLAWSPEEVSTNPQRADRIAAPGGYQFAAKTIRGFSLTHLSGTGCAGASGDIPFMPVTGEVTASPASDPKYNSTFSHDNETASAGVYTVKLDNGVAVELTATPRTGFGRFTYPSDKPAALLIRASDSETGSTDATVKIDKTKRIVTGSVTSGNFCGYIGRGENVDRRSYYTLYFTAHFDQPFLATGAWQDDAVKPGETSASGGTTYGTAGYPPKGKGSGAWVSFDPAKSSQVNVRVAVSYVSVENAEANLRDESREKAKFEEVGQEAHAAWARLLSRIEIAGGTRDQQTVFYTALYHSLHHMNLASDVNGEYRGMDQKVHKIDRVHQRAQYANFSGWDVYRSQLQLVALIDPETASDMGQSLLNQANQADGEWDRWTHNSGETHVMSGDPAAPSLADIAAFGGNRFDLKSAYASLLKAATVPTAHDLSNAGCGVACVGQRPSLDQWMKIHYIAAKSNAWGGAAETLEDATADFAMSELARRAGDTANQQLFLARAQYWKNLFNPKATPDAGYIQNRNEDGTWPAFQPSTGQGFVEGSAAVYLWMVPFNAQGLFDVMGGTDKAVGRLDAFFHNADGSLAVTKKGALHAELDNEPSIAAPWLYDFAGKPYLTQQIIREVLNGLWTNEPKGIPGNDDLGAMSSWYVWSALGLYPEIPGRAELVIGSPLFPAATIRRPGASITIQAPEAATDVFYVQSLKVNGKASSRPWLPESFIGKGGRLEFTLGKEPDKTWGASVSDAPPSFQPK